METQHQVSCDEFGPISLQPYRGHCHAQRTRPWRQRATYVRRGGVGYFLGAYDVHTDVLFGSYRPAKTSHAVLAFYTQIRRRYPVELVATPTPASHFNRIECPLSTLRECVLHASDYAGHADVAVAFRRYLYRRNVDHQNTRIRLIESGSKIV